MWSFKLGVTKVDRFLGLKWRGSKENMRKHIVKAIYVLYLWKRMTFYLLLQGTNQSLLHSDNCKELSSGWTLNKTVHAISDHSNNYHCTSLDIFGRFCWKFFHLFCLHCWWISSWTMESRQRPLWIILEVLRRKSTGNVFF